MVTRFPEFLLVTCFPVLKLATTVFPRFVLVTCFPALVLVAYFPALFIVTSFPALDRTCYTFSRALYCICVFLHRFLVTSFWRLVLCRAYAFSNLVCMRDKIGAINKDLRHGNVINIASATRNTLGRQSVNSMNVSGTIADLS